MSQLFELSQSVPNIMKGRTPMLFSSKTTIFYKYKGCDDLKGSRLDDYNMIPSFEQYDKEYLDKAENDVVQGLNRLMVR